MNATANDFVRLRAEIRLKKRSYPVQFATSQVLIDPYEIALPMYVRKDIGREVILPGSNASGAFISYDRKGNRVTDPNKELHF